MKKVVIIGGGFAGAVAARNLERDFDVTLIDTKDYFEFTPSILRTLVEPQHVKKIQVLHTHYLHKAHIVRDSIIKIKDSSVSTNQQEFSYDYLIIASGSRYETPIKETNRVVASRGQELRLYAQKLRHAQDVLIIGGGIVGVELAAEISTHYPEKEITLIHTKPELMERTPQKAQRYAKQWLEKRKVQLIFNERIIENESGVYKTRTGKKLHPDIAFLCTGIMPNYEHLASYCSIELNSKNFLCVNEYLQVQGHKNIFAAGDINNIKEEKTAQSAEKQARLVVKNIYHLEQGEPLLMYNPEPKPMVIKLRKIQWNFYL